MLGGKEDIRHNFPTEAARLADERDVNRQTNPADLSIRVLSNKVYELVNTHIQGEQKI